MTDHLASSPPATLATHGPGAILAARETDPATCAWMTGAPPPPALQVRFDDNSMSKFPQLRWAFASMRELVPTVSVDRGTTPARPFPTALRDDINALTFQPGPGGGFDAPIRWDDALLANFTDAIVVVHRGTIVYERYFGIMTPSRPHLLASVSKSFAGTLAAMLIDAGSLDPDAPVTEILPELMPSGFATVTLRHLLDMTTGLQYSEDYTSPTADIADLARAAGWAPRRPDTPDGLRAYLPTIPAAGTHGERFTYRTCNTDVLAWALHRVTGKRLHQLLGDMLWSNLGMAQDAHYSVDAQGTEFAGGGLNCTCRDLARFGEAMRLGGENIIPGAVVADIARGADPAKFAPAGYTTLPGWSYRNQWWVSADGPYTARGVRGQMLWIDPAAEMVIARFASHPLAGNANLDPVSLTGWRALTAHLMRG